MTDRIAPVSSQPTSSQTGSPSSDDRSAAASPEQSGKLEFDLRWPEVELGIMSPVDGGREEFGETSTVTGGVYIPALELNGWQAGVRLGGGLGPSKHYEFGQNIIEGAESAQAGLEIRTPREKHSGVRAFFGAGVSYHSEGEVKPFARDEVHERADFLQSQNAGTSLAECTRREDWAYGSDLSVQPFTYYVAGGLDFPIGEYTTLRIGANYAEHEGRISGGVDSKGNPGPGYDFGVGGLSVGPSLRFHPGDRNTGPTLFGPGSDFYAAPYAGAGFTGDGDVFPFAGGELGVHKENRDYFVFGEYAKKASRLYGTKVGSSDEIFAGVGFGHRPIDSLRWSVRAGAAVDVGSNIDDALARETLVREYSANHGDLPTLVERDPETFSFDNMLIEDTSPEARIALDVAYQPFEKLPLSVTAGASYSRSIGGALDKLYAGSTWEDDRGWWEQERSHDEVAGYVGLRWDF